MRESAGTALGRAAHWLPFATAALYVLLLLRPLALHSGIPAFQHDWLWPVDGRQMYGYATQGLFAWERAGGGSFQVYPVPWWPPLMAAGFCALGPHVGLVLFLVFWIGLGSLGIARMSRTFGLGSIARAVTVAVFLGNPVVLNELQAGHIYFIISYNLLPWVYVSARNRTTAAGSIVTGVLLGLASAQHQFFVMGGLVALAGTDLRERTACRRLALALLVAAVVSSPSWIDGAVAGVKSLDVDAPVIKWEVFQSTSISESFRMLGYTSGYDARMVSPLVKALLWAIPAFAALGVVLSGRNVKTWWMAFIALAGVVATSGLRGPASAVFSFAFAHVSASGFFRELYNASALTAVGASLLSGCAVRGVGKLRHGAILAATIFATTLAATLPVAWEATDDLPRAMAGMTALASLNENGDAYRFITIPGIFPQKKPGRLLSGMSPWLIQYGPWASGMTDTTSFPSTLVARTCADAGRCERSQFLLRRSGVGVVAALSGAVPDFAHADAKDVQPLAEPEQAGEKKSVFVTAQAERLVAEPFSARPGTIAFDYVGARDIRPYVTEASVPIALLSRDPDPLHGWARTNYWPSLPDWVFREDDGIFTLEPAIDLDIAPATIVVGSATGKFRTHGCAYDTRLDDHWLVLRCAAHPALEAAPPIAVASVAVRTTAIPRTLTQGAFGRASIQYQTPTYVRAAVVAKRGSVLVLRDRYDDAWKLDVPSARHVEVDGYANGWVLDRDLDAVVNIRYMRAWPKSLAIVVSAILVSLGLALGYRRATPTPAAGPAHGREPGPPLPA